MWPGLFAAGASLAGGILGNLWTDERQEDAQRFNAEQAQKMMDFQERMSSTAYQRTMRDMRLAHLNPILAYQKGPTSSPTGAMASTSFTPAGDIGTPAVNSAIAASKATEEIKNMQETNKNLMATLDQIKTETARIGSQKINIDADTLIKGEILKQAQRDASKSDADKRFYDSTLGHYMRMLGTMGEEFGRVWRPTGGSYDRLRLTVHPNSYSR